MNERTKASEPLSWTVAEWVIVATALALLFVALFQTVSHALT